MPFVSVDDMALGWTADRLLCPGEVRITWVCKFFLYQDYVALLGGERNDRGYRRAGAGPFS